MFVCLHSKPWYKTLLSKVRYDPETKEAVGAEAIMNIWLLKENGTIVSGNKLTLNSDFHVILQVYIKREKNKLMHFST